MIALGGGSVRSERVRDALGSTSSCCSSVDADARMAARAQRRERQRPLAHDRDAFRALHAQRAPLYEELADAVIPARRARGDAARWRRSRAVARAGGHAAAVGGAASGEYPVLVGRGLLGRGRCCAAPSGRSTARSRAFCVSDENVADAVRRDAWASSRR